MKNGYYKEFNKKDPDAYDIIEIKGDKFRMLMLRVGRTKFTEGWYTTKDINFVDDPNWSYTEITEEEVEDELFLVGI